MVSSRKAKQKRLICSAIVSALVLALAVTVFFALDSELTSTEYRVELSNLPSELEGYRILVIADLHCAEFGPGQSELISAVQAQNPDLIVLCGDILDSNQFDFAHIEALLDGIGNCPVIAIHGNHENSVSYFDRRDLADLYRKYGVELLVDESVTVDVGDCSFQVSGMDDPSFWGKGDLDYVFKNPPDVTPEEDMFNILLCHRANVYPAVADLGFDLVLSGHLHGGQVRLPFGIGLISPTRQWFPDFTAGVYSEGSSTLVVSRGLGNSVDVPRIFNPPELVTVVLCKK